MKKILPVIITLIGLSLLGLIILQASWLNNLLVLRRAQIWSKVNIATRQIANDLSNEIFNNNTVKVPRRLQGLNLGGDMFNILHPKTVMEHYSAQEVEEKIKRAFNDEELRKLQFEFAVAANSGDYEIQSGKFAKYDFDTSNSKKIFFPIFPGTGTDDENLSLAEHLIIIIPNFDSQVWGSLTWIILGSALFTIIIITAFFITIKTLLNQKKLSEIKSDFINNMTHEFKTPIATISLAVDAIRNEKVQSNPEKLQYFSNIIKEENKRMNKHVETILQAALLEKKELQFNIKKINANLLIATVVDNYQLQLNEKGGKCNLSLNAADAIIEADELHFTNIISNLVDNAIKYSRENLTIEVKTYNESGRILIEIEDNGIGMSRETMKNVFEKFYRAHTGNVHNVKGFGLGMSYVKTIVDAMNGDIKVDSTLGKGTTFTLEFPLASVADA